MEPQKPTSPFDTKPQPSQEPPAAPVNNWSHDSVTPNMPASAGPLPTVDANSSKKKTWMLAVIIAAVVLVLGGGAAAAYFGYIVPNKPENVLKAALVNGFSKTKAKSAHFSGTASVKSGSDPAFNVTYSGASSNETGAFKLEGKLDALVANVTFDLRSVDGKSMYVRVGGFDGIPELLGAQPSMANAYGPMIAAINNQWLEINQSLLNQVSGGSAASMQLSDADLAKLAAAYEQNQFLSVKEKLADEKIKDVDSYHLKVAIDNGKLKGFVQAVKEANISNLKITDEQLSEYNSGIDQADFSKYPIDVWISKSSKQMTQLAFRVTEDDNTFDFRLTVDSYNQPVNVEKPEGAKSILEVLMSQMTGGGDPSALLMQDIQSGISL